MIPKAAEAIDYIFNGRYDEAYFIVRTFWSDGKATTTITKEYIANFDHENEVRFAEAYEDYEKASDGHKKWVGEVRGWNNAS